MVWWRIIFALIIVQITAFYRQLFLRKIPSSIQSLKNFATLIITVRNCQTYSAHHVMNSGNLFTMLVLGASIAAATQIFVPRFIINAVGGDIFPISHIHDHAKFHHFDMLQHRRILRTGLRAKFHNRLNFIFLAIRTDDRH